MAIDVSSLSRRFISRILPRESEKRDDLIAGPIRGELLGAERLAERARTVAKAQRLAEGERGQWRTPLLARLDGTRRILDDAQARIGGAAERDLDVGPAGEWLLDNFHVLQEHIREVRESLPRGYYRELPELAAGALAGYPRVYELAITLISHTEGRIDIDNVDLFVGAFQKGAALSIGELWAVPAMLRLGLIENVRRMALRTVQRLDEVRRADDWAARMQEATEQGEAALGAALNDFVTVPPPLTAIFVSRFLHQLRLARGSFPPLVWLEQWIADEGGGVSSEEAAARSTQRLALTQITMANSITSLRAIARMDWQTLVERQSGMEAELRKDPSGFHEQMTFATRDHYRHVVERIAKRTGLREEDIARRAVALAARRNNPRARGTRTSAAGGPAAGTDSGDLRSMHVGYYLIDDGLAELERATAYRPGARESVHRWVLRHPNVIFVGGILAGTAAALALLFLLAGPAAHAAWIAVILFALIPANDIAVNVMNQLVSAFLPPRMLPKLDLLEHGAIPPEFRTAVVIPTLFDSVDTVRDALETIEVQFLANRDAHLHFAILSDFTDSASESRPEDAAIVAAAADGVRALNVRYVGHGQDAFYLFHRPRRWNERQGVWMGWERKRGKLAEFNRFVRGDAGGAFSAIVGDPDAIRQVRYVITLDSDTVLPPDAAPLLIGALAHPLNRAFYDPARGRVVRGYGILQPRVGVSLPSAHRSRFASIHSGHPGVDPYTTAVSDVYQDLYGEGSFTGKGIYDVDAFEQATRGRFPENTLLSHDLIEGSYARAGLATDIIVYDDYPTRYLTYTRRKHRWIRGDWQLLDWLTPRVPGPDGAERNRLSVISRWKILDNIRRSTVEIAQLLFLIAGWTLLPGSPLRWTLLGLGAIAAPWIVSLLLAAVRPPLDKSWRAYYAAVGRDAVTSAQQVALAIAFLPHQAWVSADAIVRTVWRLSVTKRHLLEWQTSSHAERSESGAGRATWRRMSPAIVLTAGIVLVPALVEFARPESVSAGYFPLPEMIGGDARWRLWRLAAGALPLIALWLASPGIALAMSAPAVRRERRLPRASRRDALRYALLHWRFFDRFVTSESNWLAPDNFQESPTPVVAMRTSPTNIGLQLLAVASAFELGFSTLPEMTRRLELSFRTLERMRRFRGHLYNWYDLRDLRVLEPAYISTVDSGNLAGHLIALRQACVAFANGQVPDGRGARALDAALAIAEERLRDLAASDAADAPGSVEPVAAAAQRVHEARVALPAGGRARQTPGSLAELAPSLIPILEDARDVLATSTLARDVLLPAAEWIEWGLRRLADESALDDESGSVGEELVSRLNVLADRAYDYAMEMDFHFLFDDARELFAIGYQQNSHCLDVSYYDLLASEARLASFIAVAKNDVPLDHWFRLGRTLTHAAGETALVSWSGSMFEYLMPALVMQSFPFTVLDQSCEGAVRRHVAYGTERGVPWGVSESAYNLRDRHLTYQYRAFGVPDLALKRGLGRDLVVAPYASALAIMVDPQRALANLATMEGKGALGRYGFRDALDYTRPDPGKRFAIVQTYMAHHIGMGLVALTNALADQLWRRRFHADPLVRSAELLLHERIPRRLVLQEAQATRTDEALPDPDLERPAVREVDSTDTEQPHIALLGHLPYTIMVSHCGGGYSRYEKLAVTRWRADGTRDATGQFCYLRDVSAGRTWSAAHQPVCAPADWYHALLATDRVTFHRSDGGIETRTEIAVVPEDAAEVRRVTVSNNGGEPREVELTSYGEIVLTTPEADRTHPAFANLFVETEWHEWCSAITATRRPRSSREKSLWCVHVVDTGKDRVGRVTYETDRARFVGRGRSTRNPVALDGDGPLSCTTGAVLDPVFAIRTRVRLEPGQSASVAFTTLVAATRERAFELADRYHDAPAAQRALDLAWTSTQVELRELDITPADAAIFQELAGHLFYANESLRAPREELDSNHGSQPLLWTSGISGDWPVLLATIDSLEGLPTLRQLFAAHHYWRRRGMMVDLVVVNAQPSSYLQELNDRITATMYGSGDLGVTDQPGGVFLRRADMLGDEAFLMLRATARVHVTCDGRSLGRVVDASRPAEEVELENGDFQPPTRPSGRHTPPSTLTFSRIRARAHAARNVDAAPASQPPAAGRGPAGSGVPGAMDGGALLFDNGLGGLTSEGDYRIRVRGDRVPPAPWANVIANERGGFIVSERGAGCTWAGNSYFFRLTPWHNDPVSDPVSEVIYLRDDDSAALWCATPAPIAGDLPYVVHHGAGKSSFDHERDGIATHLELGMAGDDPVKISLLRVTNRGTRSRRLTLTAYAEWTLGIMREHTQHQIHTAFADDHEAILARNFFDPQFALNVAFAAMSEPLTGHTADRREMLGRNGNAAAPAALAAHGPRLAGTTGAGIDPCAALQCSLPLAPGETREIVVILGAAESESEALRLIAEYRDAGRARGAATRLTSGWTERLSIIRVRTPEPSFDAMLNRWSLYQALSCRMWGRSAVYQSSGAYGFRDQLQDVMAFVYAEPAIAREHILRATARQFVEGDVQHWWHPHSGRGVRTRFSDDLAWLPHVVDHYVCVTGDASVLQEYVPFLEMRALEPHEHEVYDLPRVTDEHGSVYEHCLRALGKACTIGVHGLPLIGIGDWNDGMNRVGVEGRGESVWLAWFLITTLRSFAAYAEERGDAHVAQDFLARAEAYAAAVEEHAWDGEWYRRAYFDDGTPLGSASSDECRIDSIAQSWSVLSQAGDPARQARAMQSLEEHLVREDARLLMLLTPPFDKTPHDPGYIKGYLPGVRENGAQYTHAALWAVLATALRGDGDRAFELYQMINPLTHSRTPEEVAVYRVEPYVVAADVYTADGQLGRGGWTWYTGSASWMYRVGLEGILGFRKRGDRLVIDPRVPAGWREFGIEYRHGRSVYAISVQQVDGAAGGAREVRLDGHVIDGGEVPLVDDGAPHEVVVRIARLR
ncbi:MAG: GH36-type glycosyl hydrolase domain-containing protein [Gemmatimonadaceae bacterium]